jgi:polygalacturonase
MKNFVLLILKPINRELFHILSLFFMTSTLFFFSCKSETSKVIDEDPWLKMQQIEDSIVIPKFLDKTYNILDFGAVPDGLTNNTEAFKKAIETCSENGGGKVLVPKGKYLTGAIHLENNVNLNLEEESEIIFSTNPKDYYPLVSTSFEGVELINYSPLIYAHNKKNIAVSGKGILNGQASNENWWTWKGSDDYGWEKGMASQLDSLNLPRIMEMAENGVPVNERVFGDGHYLRPSFFEPFNCENVMLEGVKIINAPYWIIHHIKSKNVIIHGVKV